MGAAISNVPTQALDRLAQAKAAIERAQRGEATAPIDPATGLPQVQEAAPPSNEPPVEQEASAEPGVTDDPARTNVLADIDADTDQPPYDAAPTQAAPDAGLQSRLDEIQGRLATLQDRWNTEIPRLTEQLMAQAEQIRQRDQEIAALRARPVAPEPVKELTDDELMQRYGLTEDQVADRDAIDIALRIAQGMTAEAKRETSEATSREVATLRERMEEQAKERFDARICERVPEGTQWLYVDNPKGQAFAQWLRSRPGWRSAMQAAYAAQDLETVVEVLHAYRATLNGQQGAKSGGTGVQRPDAASQVAPGPRGNQPRPASGGKKTYSAQEWAEFCARMNQLKPGSAPHAELYEEFKRALSEGRVKPPDMVPRR